MSITADKFLELHGDRILKIYENRSKSVSFFKANLIRRKRSPIARKIANGNQYAIQRAAYFKLKSAIGNENFEKFRKKVCDDFDYCNRGVTQELLEYVVGFIITSVIIPEPTAAFIAGLVLVALFILNRNKLHELCDCDEKKQG